MSQNISHFSTGQDIHNLFRSNKQDIPLETLKTLRNQLSVRPEEGTVTLQDDRLVLAKEWLQKSPGAQDVLDVLYHRPPPAVEAACLSILASLLTLTSYHFVSQSLGDQIVKILLTPRWLRKLSMLLTSGHSELCMATLKLLNSVNSFAKGKAQRTLLESFPLEVKTFQRLLFMRRKDKSSGRDALSRPDIRTLCLQFILSFLSSSSHVKSMFLEQHRDLFLSIFKGLSGDPYPVVHYVLETLWTALWQDQKIKRTLKVGLFGERTLQHLVKLYEREEQDDNNTELPPADVVHHFLLAICTHRGTGICFADKGWYPRQDNDQETSGRVDKIHNKVLANFLKMLKVGDDARQQELVLKILQACPELVAGYLQFLAPMLEPRLSSRWLANAALLSAAISLPVPTESFRLRAIDPSSSTSQATYQPTPPPLSTVVGNIIPSTIIKAHLTKALQSVHPLVQHVAGLLLAQCLSKYKAVQDAFREVQQALEESEVDGQWVRRLNEVGREIRKRVPDVGVVIAFASAHQASAKSNIKSTMLAELSQRLLWQYYQCLPSVMTEARYDIAKSLKYIISANENAEQMSAEITRLNSLQQLHVLRMLIESDQFIWYARAASSSPSNLRILLELYLGTQHPSVRQTVLTLLTQSLRDSILFQHDPEELQIWLDALPTSIRSDDAETPDGVRLLDERQTSISFLDACMQRCAKTPHRYIEEQDTLSRESGSASSISPVMITMLEQINARLRTGVSGPSDVLAQTTFIRRVMVGLLGKQPDLIMLGNLSKTLRTAVTAEGVLAEFPTISAAVRRECDILDDCLAWCFSTLRVTVGDPNPATAEGVTEFDAKAEELQNRITQAYGLVDWLRLVDRPLSTSILTCVASAVKKLHSPALSILCFYLVPRHGLLWSLPDDDLVNNVPIDWMLFHIDNMVSGKCRYVSVLRTTLQRYRRTLHQYKLFLGLLNHRLHDRTNSDDIIFICEVLLFTLEHAKKELSSREFHMLKAFLLSERKNLRQLACAHDLTSSVVTAVRQLVETVLDPMSVSDQQLVFPICSHWASTVVVCMEHAAWQSLSGATVWISFMSHEDLIRILEQLLLTLQNGGSDLSCDINGELLSLVDALLTAPAGREASTLSMWLNLHLAELLSLRRFIPTTEVLDRIILRSLRAILPFGYDGVQAPEAELSLRDAIHRAQLCWSSRLLPLQPDASLALLLDEDDWSIDLSNTIAALVYRCPNARRSFWSWLKIGYLSQKPALKKLVPIIHAFFDSNPGWEAFAESESPFTRNLFDAMAKEFCIALMAEKDAALLCLCLADMIKNIPSQRNNFLEKLSTAVDALPVNTLHREALHLTQFLSGICGDNVIFMEAVLRHALTWAVQHLSGRQTSDEVDETSISAVVDVVRLSRNVAVHFAEPVITVAIDRHIHHTESMRLVQALLTRVSLKPAEVNKYLQKVLQHPKFAELASSATGSDQREVIAKFLFTLFLIYPANTCRPSHVEPLIQMYSGSLASADRLILSIFRLFEEQQKISVASIMPHWSQSNLSSQQTSLDALLSIDAPRVFRTCVLFPFRRTIFDGIEEIIVSREEDALLYDPVFLLLLFAQVLDEQLPQSAVSWVSLYRTNIVSLVIRCLSSGDEFIRKIALLQLGKLYEVMQTVEVQEKAQIVYTLDVVRNLLQKTSDDSKEIVPRIPSYTSLFLAHALRGILYPASFTYPLISRFLLQRPEMDKQDIPMLYSMLFSSSDSWKKERGWIVRFLADGMASKDDWRVAKRRHAWDLLASLFQGSYGDKALRLSILDVLANLTCQSRVTISLVLRSSLVHWIEIQLLTINHDEALAWAKIIENILVIIDLQQFEQATGGEWQRGLLRCLTRLIPSSDMYLLYFISRTLMRLDSKSLFCSASVKHALDRALTRLRVLEDTSDLPVQLRFPRISVNDQDLPPHHSTRLRQSQSECSLETWGRTIEHLWSFGLKHGVGGSMWDQLSSRLLLWRVIAGGRVSPIGEWARKQAVYCFGD